MDLSIIIINYNTFQLTSECIDRTLTFNNALHFEIILVDNNSTEWIPESFTNKYPSVKLIENIENLGFARANNAGIKAASGKVILLLNSDAWVEDNAIECCCNKLSKSEYIAAGVQLFNSDRTPQISGNYFITGGLNQLMALPYTGRFLRGLGYTFKIKKTNVPEAKGTVEVDWINGAFLMVKKEAIEKAGMMDEDFFLYFEEIEWCARLRKIGKMCIYGDLNAIHLQGASANDAFGSAGQGYYNLFDRKGLQIMISGMVRIRKQFGVAWFIFHLLFYLFTIPIFFIGVFLTSILKRRSFYSFKQFRGYVKNCMTLLSYSFTIIRNKPYFYKFL